MTDQEMLRNFWKEDRAFQALLAALSSGEARAEADYLYQEGVRVAEIAATIAEEFPEEVSREAPDA